MYKIKVRTLQGSFLTFTVEKYAVDEGFVTFTDRITGAEKRFAVSNCEIELVEDS